MVYCFLYTRTIIELQVFHYKPAKIKNISFRTTMQSNSKMKGKIKSICKSSPLLSSLLSLRLQHTHWHHFAPKSKGTSHFLFSLPFPFLCPSPSLPSNPAGSQSFLSGAWVKAPVEASSVGPGSKPQLKLNLVNFSVKSIILSGRFL